MNKIGFVVGQAPGVTVDRVNADATLSSSAGGLSVFAGVVLSRRGRPGQVLSVTGSNYLSVLGTPIHPRTGTAFEPLRHVERAVKGGEGRVVRVCPPDMRSPGLVIPFPAEKVNAVEGVSLSDTAIDLAVGESLTFEAENGAQTFAESAGLQSVVFGPHETPTLPEGALAVIYIKDGDASENRTLTLAKDDSGLYLLSLNEIQADGTVNTLESHQVSFDPDALTDMNLPAWLPVLLESSSSRLGAVVSTSEAPEDVPLFTAEAFKGGTDGTYSKITTADYQKALTVLENSPENFTALLSLGCYDPLVIDSLNSLAEDFRIDMFHDLNNGQLAVNAIKEAQSQALGGSHQSARYYFPYSCLDTFSRMQVVYGLSCDAFVAKAKGVAMVSDVGGWFYSPAGVSRGVIDRKNITPLPNMDVPDAEAFVAARINTVAVSSAGEVYINDALTTFSKKNYLRFQHVSSLMNAIARSFYAIAETVKHEPDGITQASLTDGMTDYLDRQYAAGALVIPRDTTQGTEPYILEVVQKEIDLWEVTWSVCPTGTARRINGKPVLMR